MTAEWCIATPALPPLSFVEWEHSQLWFVYIAGVRTGSVIAGEASAMYRSVAGGYKLFGSLHECIAELERVADYVMCANAEMCRPAVAA